MKKLKRLWSDDCGQDLIEYALMCIFVAVAAGAIMPGVSENIQILFGKINASMNGVAYVTTTPSSSAQMPTYIRLGCAGLAALALGTIVVRRRNPE